MNKLKIMEVFRWVAILPGSIICAILVMFPIHWAVMLIQFAYKKGDTINVEGPMGLLACIPPSTLEHLGYAIFVPMVLIITAAEIAPRFKFQIGIAIAIFWGWFLGFGSGVIVTRKLIDSWPLYWISLSLGIIGCAIGLLKVHKDQKKKYLDEKLLPSKT